LYFRSRKAPGAAVTAAFSPKRALAVINIVRNRCQRSFTVAGSLARFTRPGTVHFEKGEPFCFILPVPHMRLEAIQPQLLRLCDDPELAAEHAAWAASRAEFNKAASSW
jgi:hypothetical protein